MSKIKMNENRKEFVTCALDVLGPDLTVINRDGIYQVLDAYDGLKFPSWQVSKGLRTNERGEYYVPTLDGEFAKDAASNVNQITTKAEVPAIAMAPSAIGVMDQQDSYVPEKFEGYVPYGNFNTVKDVIKSGIFYPMFITGLSGNGKTLMVKEVCAKQKREYVRANITVETDEDDLIGGFRLLNGETVWHDGPVVTAMKRGAVLLLDEIDLASNKIMALQPVLEGSSIYLKKIGKWVHPTPGFNVIATANTKGQGSDDGRFIGTNILNEAFLERFAITIEQPYANPSTETKIILGAMEKYGLVDNEFAKNLVTWAEIIRKLFSEGGVDEVISTRRLDHIVKAYTIFHDKKKAVELCISRFDEDTKYSFWELYSNIDAGINPLENSDEGEGGDQTSSDVQI